ncbi:MAG: hypothetical protein AAF614_24905 [Chloroflexota bacterium]
MYSVNLIDSSKLANSVQQDYLRAAAQYRLKAAIGKAEPKAKQARQHSMRRGLSLEKIFRALAGLGEGLANTSL